MCEAKDFPPSERDELMGLVTQLQGQVAQLTAAKEELHKQVAELKRAGKRQAAPFSKGGRSSRPKRPGRKPGLGSFSYRKSPSPDEVTEPLVTLLHRPSASWEPARAPRLPPHKSKPPAQRRPEPQQQPRHPLPRPHCCRRRRLLISLRPPQPQRHPPLQRRWQRIGRQLWLS